MTLADSASSSSDTDELRARLDRLEAENARLRASAEDVAIAPSRRRRGTWRAFLSAVCIVLATVLVPVSVVTAWARTQLVDETTFVATFAPLVDDPAVQSLIVDQTTDAINSSVDFAGITNDLFDGIEGLGLPPRASAAVDLLREPAVQGLNSLVTTTVTRVVASDAFASVWQGALTASHRGFVAAATGGTSGGAVTISDTGQIGLQLGPIIDAVKQRLVDQGVGFASAIPTINRTIVIAQSDSLATISVVYGLAVTVGFWLPFVALAFFLAGILIARRRSTALLGTGVGIAIGGTTLAAGFVIGGSVLALSAPKLGVSSIALTAIYDQIIGAAQQTAVVVAVIGVVIAVLAWVGGRWRGAQATRRAVGAVNQSIRTFLAARGVDTGRFGSWMFAQHVLVRVVLAVLLVGWLVLLRPLGAGDITLVLVVGLLVWWLTELVQKRPGEGAGAGAADAVTLADEALDAELVVAGARASAVGGTAVLAPHGVDQTADTAVIDPDAVTEVVEPVDADAVTEEGTGATGKRPPRPRTPQR
ncbi:hypothetical protein [uncultured Microbacterium sp.]|uniref:hypothetical protein n=1 Tax=uncultured Microbacterium sp. TaxID=191216 RepID=UPI0035CB91AC